MLHRSVPFCFLLSLAAALQAADVYVAPSGTDTNPGTRDKPFASVQKALEAMQGLGKPGTVWLAPGEYVVEKGIVLGSGLGGTTDSPMVIRSEVPLKARITGARKIAGFRAGTAEEVAPLISEVAKKHVRVADLQAQGFPPLMPMPGQFRAPGREEVIFGDTPMQAAPTGLLPRLARPGGKGHRGSVGVPRGNGRRRRQVAQNGRRVRELVQAGRRPGRDGTPRILALSLPPAHMLRGHGVGTGATRRLGPNSGSSA